MRSTSQTTSVSAPIPEPPLANPAAGIHVCANCSTRFHHTLSTAVWTSSERPVWYCSRECAEAMPFLPDRAQMALARQLQGGVYMADSATRRMQAAQRRMRDMEREIEIRARRAEADARSMSRQTGGGIDWTEMRREGRVDYVVTRGHRPAHRPRPLHFTGQEPEDL